MRVIVDGLAFGDGLRWHDGALWVSDMHAGEVLRIDRQGGREVIHALPGSPSGLGWLPDGRLLVVAMEDRALWRAEPDGEVVLHADLSAVATFHANDMVVDGRGRAYVGNMGSDFVPGTKREPAELALVHPDGTVEPAGSGPLGFPNGTIVTPDGATLVAAETMGRRLLAWDIGADGRLSDRRTWADLGTGLPDGICLDAEGAIWYADPRAKACVRVAEGGEELDRVATTDRCYSCALGGPDRRLLHVVTAPHDDPDQARAHRAAAIHAVEVEVPGAGCP